MCVKRLIAAVTLLFLISETGFQKDRHIGIDAKQDPLSLASHTSESKLYRGSGRNRGSGRIELANRGSGRINPIIHTIRPRLA